MSRLDLHADGLLDRARRGQLGREERARLVAHCTECAACRAELQWIEDGLHREAPNAEDRARGAAAVDALLGAGAPARPKERGRIAFWKAAAAVSAGLLVASGAAALYSEVRALRERIAEVSAREIEAQETKAKEAKPRRSRAARAKAAVPSPSVSPLLNPSEGPGPEPERGPGLEPVRRQESVRRSIRTGVLPGAALFARANAARDAGRYGEAASAYAELARSMPGTREEIAARVSRGQLLLQHLGRPAEALPLFESYLAALPRGALAEEARAGVAVCEMRLGRGEKERNAWENLLERHPHSLHAARARARLAELAPPLR